MGFQIESGGTNSDHAKVTLDGRLDVSSKADGRIYYVSRDDKRAFSVTSVDTGGSADGEYILYLQNDDADRDIIVHKIICGAPSTTRWALWEVTGTAAGGSALTPKNLALGSGRTASATARGDGAITGLGTSGNEIAVRSSAAGADVVLIDGDELRIPEGSAIAIEFDNGTDTDVAHAEVIFFYETAAN